MMSFSADGTDPTPPGNEENKSSSPLDFSDEEFDVAMEDRHQWTSSRDVQDQSDFEQNTDTDSDGSYIDNRSSRGHRERDAGFDEESNSEGEYGGHYEREVQLTSFADLGPKEIESMKTKELFQALDHFFNLNEQDVDEALVLSMFEKVKSPV